MNDPQFIEASRYLAQRAMRDAGDGFQDRLDYITTRLIARQFNIDEQNVARRSYDRLLMSYQSDGDGASRLINTGDSVPDSRLPAIESAAWTMLVNQLMNLDEVLNK